MWLAAATQAPCQERVVDLAPAIAQQSIEVDGPFGPFLRAIDVGNGEWRHDLQPVRKRAASRPPLCLMNAANSDPSLDTSHRRS